MVARPKKVPKYLRNSRDQAICIAICRSLISFCMVSCLSSYTEDKAGLLTFHLGKVGPSAFPSTFLWTRVLSFKSQQTLTKSLWSNCPLAVTAPSTGHRTDSPPARWGPDCIFGGPQPQICFQPFLFPVRKDLWITTRTHLAHFCCQYLIGNHFASHPHCLPDTPNHRLKCQVLIIREWEGGGGVQELL